MAQCVCASLPCRGAQEEIYEAFRDYQAGRFQSPEDNPWVDE